jgi:hypothetical protein
MISEETEEISKFMKRIAVSYVYYFNKKYKRVGHLFQDRFKSEVVDKDEYALALVRYIHHNPIHHFYTDKLEDYNWSSYKSYLSKLPTKLKREEAIQWFGSSQEFLNFAEKYKTLKKAFHWIIEEE